MGTSPCCKGVNAGAGTGIVQPHKYCPRWRGGRASLETQLPGGRSPPLPATSQPPGEIPRGANQD